MPTIVDIYSMKETMDDMMRNYIEDDLMVQIPKKEALVYYGPLRNLKAHARYLWNNDWFYLKKGNAEAKKLTISLHKIHATPFLEDDLVEILKRWALVYKKKHIKERSDPNKVYSYHQILEVIRIENKKEYGQDFMEEIIMKRADGKDSKNEKRVMNIEKIPKFCDATLKKVLMRDVEINQEVFYRYKDPPFGDVEKGSMKIFEEEIHKRLKHRRHMKRRKSFVEENQFYIQIELSHMEDHTSDWLRVVPISGLRQVMNACSRVFASNIYGDHVVSCAGIVRIKYRHNIVRDTLVDICFRSGILVAKDVDIGLGSSPLTQIGMIDFVPEACCDRGCIMELEKDAVTLMKRIRKFSMTQDIGAHIVHIISRIGFAITREVRAQRVSHLPTNFL
ncbi:hypothetical protein Tco_0875867 [Tanacetum coccineum]|uniref:Uncharacterized protein n=1 Tax=Tanacetum coccineum TaxID=301880 RepID=A0ABQ5BTI5_9ASTR